MGLIIVKCITDDQIYKLKKKEGDKRDIYKEQNLRREKLQKWIKTQDLTDLLQSIIYKKTYYAHI